MLNELETVYWSITNNSIDIGFIDSELILDYLMITALFAKKLVCELSEIKVHESFLSHNYPMFMANFLMWESVTDIDKDSFDFVKVNGEFKTLFGDENGIN
jgi:hypothetical protein